MGLGLGLGLGFGLWFGLGSGFGLWLGLWQGLDCAGEGTWEMWARYGRGQGWPGRH